MKGFVPTPPEIVDLMVGKLFMAGAPGAGDSVLDPGCGDGEFIAGILRMCSARAWPIPRIVGIELDPTRASTAGARFRGAPQVDIRHGDFLRLSTERYQYIVGNPPYVSITGLDPQERMDYRAGYSTATGRFDLYGLFFEQALRMLAPGGRLVFITPEKFLYVETARRLRELLGQRCLEELHFLNEASFGERVTYPLITTLSGARSRHGTRIVRRNGTVAQVTLPGGESWQPAIEGFTPVPAAARLADVARRISCGVATGADGVFVVPTSAVSPELRSFAHPTVSGRQITPARKLALSSSLLAPYDAHGALLAEDKLGPLGDFLAGLNRREQLQARTCSARKPWYAFHDNLPLADMLRPKLLCKDITEQPFFVTDDAGSLVPRHSVYYVVPSCPADLEPLAAYLNSEDVSAWLRANCQRAANGFLRLQSHVLKQIPIPDGVYSELAASKLEPVQPGLLPA